MAIWQYNLTVLPKSIFDKEYFSLEQFIDEDGFLDDESCWLTEPTRANFFNEIEHFLPRNKSWSTNIILFGNQNSNRFEIYKNVDDFVISVSFRIDYTSEYEDILRAIISFIEMRKLVILDEEMRLLDSNFVTIKSHIEASNQRKAYEDLSKDD